MSNELWREDRFVDWLADGPVSAPLAAVEASVAYARTHPRRHLVDVGLWRRIMTRIGLTEVQPRASGQHRFTSFGLVTAVVVVVIAVVVVGGRPAVQGDRYRAGRRASEYACHPDRRADRDADADTLCLAIAGRGRPAWRRLAACH